MMMKLWKYVFDGVKDNIYVLADSESLSIPCDRE